MIKNGFDMVGFFTAVEMEKNARSCTWRQVADDTGMSASSLTRLSHGHKLDPDGVAALAAWAGIDLNKFVGGQVIEGGGADSLGQVRALLRADKNLEPRDKEYLQQVIELEYTHARKRATDE